MGKDDKKKRAYFIERKQIEGDLEESENKYRSLFENVQDVFFETNLEGIILEISPSIKYFSDFNNDELLGTSIFNLYFNPEDRNVLLNTITLQGEIRDYELKLKTKNGQIKVVSVNARLIIDSDGRPNRIDGSVRDITERKLTEDALSESETKYRYLFANNPQPMWIYDLETLTFLEVNQAAINHYGYSKEEFLSMTIRDIRPAEDIPALVNHLGLTRPILNQAGTWRHIKKNGEIIFVEITSHLVLINSRNARHVLIHDITGRKLAEEALSKSEQKYRNLHESMIDGFAYIDLLGFIKDYNESFKQLLGYSDEELSLLTYRDFTPEKWHDFEQRIITEQVLIRGFSDIYEKEYRKKDGTVFPVEVHSFLMKNDNGKNEGMWAIVRDITERKRAEEALTESRQQLLNIIDFLPDATFVVDNEKKVIAWNKAIEEMTGVQKQDMIGKRDHAYAIPFYGKQQNVFLDLIDNNDEELNARYCDVSRKGLSLHAEIFAPALNNGKGAYISVVGAPLFNGSGERIGSIESIRDVTDRKKADKALQESEERYRMLFERSNDAIFVVDISSGNYLDANKSAEILTGRPLDELKSIKTYELTPKDAGKRIKMLRDANDSLEMGEVEYIRPDGTIRTAVLNTIPISKDQVFGIAHDITDRKLAEEQLKLSNQRVALHIQHTPLAFIEFDLEGRVRGWNPAAVKIFGYSQEEAFGQYWTFIVPQKVWSSVDGVWEALVKQRGGSRSSNENITKIGQKISCEWYNTPLIDSDGKTLGVASLVMDITDRKQAVEALVKLKKAIYNSGEAIFLTDREGIFTFVNPSFTSLYGFSSDEVVGKTTPRIIKSGVSDKSVYDYFWQTLLNGDEVKGELINKRKDGTLINIDGSATPIIDEEKNIIGFLGIQRDITERKRAEERFRQQTDAMEAAIDGMALLNADGNYIYLNKSHAEIYGYDNASELIGASWRILYNIDELQRFDQEIMPELNQNGHYQGRALGKKKDGSTFHQELSLTTLENGGLICTVRDITERKKAEQELLIAKEKADESNRLKTAFLNNISHEIRTPFNGILGFLSIIQDFDLSGSERDEYINIVNKSAFRLINTINEIVEISQIQTGQLKPIASKVNIKRLIDDLFNKFKADAESKRLEYSLNNDLPIDVTDISTDSTKLNTILSILIGNAIKFTEAGSVELGIKFRNKAQLGYIPDGSIGEPIELEFSVKDTGIGIPIDRQEAIFELFMQADFSITRPFEGSGLGLSIAKAYVEMLGGEIWVESDPDNNSGRLGSTFHFTLPYKVITVERPGIDKRVSSDSTDNPITPEVPELKILIVEDDEISEMLLRKVVKSFSKEILHTTTGAEAVEAIRNNPDIDMILMDIRMPDLNGYEATKQIRQFNEKVVIFAQTAFAQSGDREMAIEAGCDDYIAKPVKKVELMELLQRYFKK